MPAVGALGADLQRCGERQPADDAGAEGYDLVVSAAGVTGFAEGKYGGRPQRDVHRGLQILTLRAGGGVDGVASREVV
ncbi:hypothetical protein ACIF9R_13795 [Streptomyces sp. NPDC086080]|uniref:hypothetical protein n=1 Tax=Streptomyces sp. NPDC086080 TaxID=3365748 RepID=UPI0037CD8166